jgi:hypothetical protein
MIRDRDRKFREDTAGASGGPGDLIRKYGDGDSRRGGGGGGNRGGGYAGCNS